MSLKSLFLICFFVVFLEGFVLAEECEIVGEVNGEKYCDTDGQLKYLKQGDVVCLNDYECLEASCVDGKCQSKFPSFEEEVSATQEVWRYFSGENCDKEVDTEYICEETVAFLCGANNVLESKGEIEGVCGYVSPGGGNGGGGSGGGSSRVDIFIYSPKEDVTYDTRTIPLEVKDKRGLARYWKYVLNGEDKVDFEPDTTFSARLGVNTLKVYASPYRSFSNQDVEEVSFRVAESVNIVCGDNICSSAETCSNCQEDCGACGDSTDYCGDGVCDAYESSSDCPEDCEAAKPSSKMWLFYILVLTLIGGIGIVGFFISKKLGLFKKGRKPVMRNLNTTGSFVKKR